MSRVTSTSASMKTLCSVFFSIVSSPLIVVRFLAMILARMAEIFSIVIACDKDDDLQEKKQMRASIFISSLPVTNIMIYERKKQMYSSIVFYNHCLWYGMQADVSASTRTQKCWPQYDDEGKACFLFPGLKIYTPWPQTAWKTFSAYLNCTILNCKTVSIKHSVRRHYIDAQIHKYIYPSSIHIISYFLKPTARFHRRSSGLQ